MPFPSLFFCTTLLCLAHKMPVVRGHCTFFPEMKNPFHCTKAAKRQHPAQAAALRCTAKRMKCINTMQRVNLCSTAERSRPVRARLRRSQGCVIGAAPRGGGARNHSVWKLFSFCNHWHSRARGTVLPTKTDNSCVCRPNFHQNAWILCNLYTKQEFSCVFHIWTK